MQRATRKRPRRKPEPVDLDAALASAASSARAKNKLFPGRLTPYAEQLLARSGGAGAQPQTLLASDEWISTGTAAKLTGYSRRHIYTLCDQGFFAEGSDWKQRPPSPGHRPGVVMIRRDALQKLKGES